jgi:YD repeat-containing protein
LHNSTANTHTATVTLTTGGSTYVLSRIEFDRASRATHQIEDDLDTTVVAFDGANRSIKTTDAEANFVEQTYDKNSNVVQVKRTDKAQTTFGFDALDRQFSLVFPDGNDRLWAFDRDSNVTTYTDENNSVSTRTYDALNRETNDSIARAAGVIGTTQQTFQYGRQKRDRSNFTRPSIIRPVPFSSPQ